MYDSHDGVDASSLKREEPRGGEGDGDDDSLKDHLELMFEDGFEMAHWAPLISSESRSTLIAESGDLRDYIERRREGFKRIFMEEGSPGRKETWFLSVLRSFRQEWDHVIAPLIRQVDGLWISMKTDADRFKKRLKRTESYIHIFLSTLKSGPAAVERRLHRMDKSATLPKKRDKKVLKKKAMPGRRGIVSKTSEKSGIISDEGGSVQPEEEMETGEDGEEEEEEEEDDEGDVGKDGAREGEGIAHALGFGSGGRSGKPHSAALSIDVLWEQMKKHSPDSEEKNRVFEEETMKGSALDWAEEISAPKHVDIVLSEIVSVDEPIVVWEDFCRMDPREKWLTMEAILNEIEKAPTQESMFIVGMTMQCAGSTSMEEVEPEYLDSERRSPFLIRLLMEKKPERIAIDFIRWDHPELDPSKQRRGGRRGGYRRSHR
eukprot:TRINITY_DN625_c0_g2_i5.p1 TRINITY_DN625_c0_g2~~TRINITY_DN625_c0_g2_i5.p1  ORF type:complete len:432 (+),score=141.39 TRINITY_DN625_c0_g2_i5:218-1513(+)